jgi:hypothetical protein
MLLIVVAGLSLSEFDRLKALPAKRFSGEGILVTTPMKPEEGYRDRDSKRLLELVAEAVLRDGKDKEVRICLVYKRSGGVNFQKLLDAFFPFALTVGFEDFENWSTEGGHVKKRRGNEYLEYIEKKCLAARKMSRIVGGHLNDRVLNPLLMPMRNFAQNDYRKLLKDLSDKLHREPDLNVCLTRFKKEFFDFYPLVRLDGDRKKHSSDGKLIFKSPGGARHGRFRFEAANEHEQQCLLNAVCRLGASYDRTLHFDCVAAKGSLKILYSNCHEAMIPPKSTHVNIFPNDFILGG